MGEGASWWSAGEAGLLVAVRATPGASRSEVLDVVEGRLRVRVAAPARDGQANAELLAVLARHFGVRRRAVTLVRGAAHRDKTVLVAGLSRPPAEAPPAR